MVWQLLTPSTMALLPVVFAAAPTGDDRCHSIGLVATAGVVLRVVDAFTLVDWREGQWWGCGMHA